MSFRDDDDDTSAGKTTQGGSTPRRGNSIFWFLGAAVIALAIVIAVLTLPRKHSGAEEGTAPVGSTLKAPAPPTLPPSVASPTR